MIQEFLEAIWGSAPFGLGEIRSIKTTDNPRPLIDQRYAPVWDFSRAASIAQSASDRGFDVYFGVLPRLREGGKADDVGDTTPILWADVDAKKADPVLATGKMKALTAINAFPIPPQVLVDSGGGYHAYWRLERDVPHALAVPVMKWIADVLVGDRVHDKPRVLRVPGTFNYKREPILARILRLDLTWKYRFTDFEALLPLVEPRPKSIPSLSGRTYRDLPEWLVEVINDGAPAGQRSETCFRAMVWLLRYGRTPDQVRQIFRDTPDGIGEKLAEKGSHDGARWLDYTLAAAEAVV